MYVFICKYIDTHVHMYVAAEIYSLALKKGYALCISLNKSSSFFMSFQGRFATSIISLESNNRAPKKNDFGY